MSSLSRTTLALAVSALAAAASGGCGIEKQEAPGLTGPSEYGTSISLRAEPDHLSRDGQATSTITVTALDANAAPLTGLQLALSVSPSNGGTLSAGEVTTDRNGRGTVIYTAPSVSTPVQSVVIGARPIGNNLDNSVMRTISLALIAPQVASPSFSVDPVSPARFQPVTFDASPTTFNGSRCGASCTYTWTFGTEQNATGEVVTYRFQQAATYTVTLTVTSPNGLTNSLERSVIVSAGVAPTATFTVSPTNPRVGDPVRFNAGSSTAANGATITEYAWDFGNGQTATGVDVTTTYTLNRTYVVRLTVTDSNGLKTALTRDLAIAIP